MPSLRSARRRRRALSMTLTPRRAAKGNAMDCYVRLKPSRRRTRIELRTSAGKPLLRASLPPLSAVRHRQAMTKLLEALSLWMDERLCVALCAGELEDWFDFGLTDELGTGARSVFYAVEVVGGGGRTRCADERQLPLLAPRDGGAR